MRTIVLLLASGFGTGYSPIASGTVGSALAALLYWFVFPKNYLIVFLISVAAFIISIPVSTEAEKIYGKKDDSHIVIDEIVGFWISVLFLPYSFKILIAAFFLFRLFDVIKPFYIRNAQKLPGGWGVVMDDIFAGILTNMILQIAVRIFHLA
ncbi:MAG: phosphatidylglycerophosphatase A [Elusimicrobia bacterium]|nr:phosphatidylglycerophosphatase A [Elusimicrobiota bacterium]